MHGIQWEFKIWRKTNDKPSSLCIELSRSSGFGKSNSAIIAEASILTRFCRYQAPNEVVLNPYSFTSENRTKTAPVKDWTLYEDLLKLYGPGKSLYFDVRVFVCDGLQTVIDDKFVKIETMGLNSSHGLPTDSYRKFRYTIGDAMQFQGVTIPKFTINNSDWQIWITKSRDHDLNTDYLQVTLNYLGPKCKQFVSLIRCNCLAANSTHICRKSSKITNQIIEKTKSSVTFPLTSWCDLLSFVDENSKFIIEVEIKLEP